MQRGRIEVYMVTVKSDALGGEIVSVCETEQEWIEEKDKQTNVAIYHPSESENLRGLEHEEIRVMHEAKKIFRGFIGDGEPKPKRNKSSLREMRDKLREENKSPGSHKVIQ